MNRNNFYNNKEYETKSNKKTFVISFYHDISPKVTFVKNIEFVNMCEKNERGRVIKF